MVRAALAVIALALVGCDDAKATLDAAVDAYPDAPPTPAIDWSIWGEPCLRPLWGTQTCVSRDGVTKGYCILTGEPPNTDGTYPGACRHYCFGNPPYVNECPPDGVAVQDGLAAQGCHCAQR